MSELSFSFKDKDGSVELVQRGQIINVFLFGACGDDVINFYAEKLQLMADSYMGEPWAYFCNSKGFQATTPQGEKKVIETYRYCMLAGCRFDAYRYDSPVGIAQTQAAMQACGNNTPIEQVLFEDEQLAIDYLLGQLARLGAKSKDIEKPLMVETGK